MTSKLSVDTIQGVSQAGNITIQGEGTKETNLQQGLCKAWVSFTQSDNTIVGSFNVSSQSDDAAGRTTTNFNNDFSNAGYSFVGQVFDGGGANDARTLNHDADADTYSASALKYYSWNGSALDDAFRFFGQFMGDLA